MTAHKTLRPCPEGGIESGYSIYPVAVESLDKVPIVKGVREVDGVPTLDCCIAGETTAELSDYGAPFDWLRVRQFSSWH
jgi:hypothetical protein